MAQADTSPLDQLALDLRRVFRARLATQISVSEALGVAQSTVSKAKRGALKRETSDTKALQKYANSLLSKRELPPAIREAAEGFFSAGGSEAELIEAITLTTRLVRGRRAA
jgi:predicted XRE-type DNA-binding protein